MTYGMPGRRCWACPRASEIHCALGLSQLGKLARFSARRRALAAAYDARIAALAPLVRPLSRRSGCAPAWHLYVALIDFACDAAMSRPADAGACPTRAGSRIIAT